MNAKRPEYKVMTLCNDRGFNINDGEYSMHSLERGYLELNQEVERMLWLNPNVILHSVSHAAVLMPMPGSPMFHLSTTIVYSGELSVIGEDIGSLHHIPLF